MHPLTERRHVRIRIVTTRFFTQPFHIAEYSFGTSLAAVSSPNGKKFTPKFFVFLINGPRSS